jgi:lambda repressor-like predicted transcriptional regulator
MDFGMNIAMTNGEPNFYKADIKKLLAAIDSTGKSKSQIASAGELSPDTLNKALKGGRVIRAKANGICKALLSFGAKEAKRELLFPHEE